MTGPLEVQRTDVLTKNKTKSYPDLFFLLPSSKLVLLTFTPLCCLGSEGREEGKLSQSSLLVNLQGPERPLIGT